MNEQALKSEYLALDEINPEVDLASFYKLEDAWHRYRIPGHHLLLIKSGRVDAVTPQGRIHGKAGDLICFRPTEHNEYGNKGELTFYQMHVNFAPAPRENLTPWLNEAGPLPIHLTLGDAFDAVRKSFETVLLELGKTGAKHQLKVRAAVFDLLATVAGVASHQPLESVELDPWYRSRLLLGGDLNRELRLEDLAQSLGISRDHFIRKFKERFGVSPIAYRTQIRLSEAIRMLRDGNRSIKAIGLGLGFSDTKTFTRTFKRYFGVPPSEFLQTALEPRKEVPPKAGLFPLNQHVLPPHAGPTWINKWASTQPLDDPST